MATRERTVQDVMSTSVEFIEGDCTLAQAAARMRDLDCGFLPIRNDRDGVHQGVITDRDIALRAVAEGMDPCSTSVNAIKSDRVLSCFRSDSLEKAAKTMGHQQVYRLLVLDDPEHHRVCGVVSLSDMVRHGELEIAIGTAGDIAS